MPFRSEAQRKWAYTKEGTKALGGKKQYKNGKNQLLKIFLKKPPKRNNKRRC